MNAIPESGAEGFTELVAQVEGTRPNSTSAFFTEADLPIVTVSAANAAGVGTNAPAIDP